MPAIYPLSGASAACGGLACFLYAIKSGRIHNNRHWRKAGTDVLGGTLVGFFLSLGGAQWGMADTGRALTAFVGGTAWAAVLEAVRKKVTDVVDAALFGAPPKKDKEEQP